MTLSVIVRENSKSQYRLVLRNTSIYDVAVKIVNPNESPKLDRLECLVLSNKYTDITVLETPSKAVLCGNNLKPVLIYCRAIYPFNRKNIRHWIEGHVTDKPHHLVQTLDFIVDDAEFSAKTIIIDLPGKSTMIESTGYALKMNNSRPVLRAFLENGTIEETASRISFCSFRHFICLSIRIKISFEMSSGRCQPDPLKNVTPSAPIENKNEDSCFVVPLFKALCNPKTKVETLAH
uniref:WHy domain-containing protein n=1 Tax=Caenorhabditis tropicalis TaxID=1561998 RepID=A0A1I7T9B2_9PELO